MLPVLFLLCRYGFSTKLTGEAGETRKGEEEEEKEKEEGKEEGERKDGTGVGNGQE